MRRLFGRIRGGVHALGHRHRHDAELEDELRAFRDADIDAKIAAGMPRITAERAARANLGSMAAVRDYVGDVGWDTWIDGVRLDIRHAARRLRAAPAFVTAVVLTLGLGVGINTAVFSVADAALFKPLPYAVPGL